MKGFYNQKLYEKAFAEYEIFLEDLLRLPKEEIVKRCYEKVYKEELVSTKVVKLIQSYTGVVNKMVWRKF